jgi:hypothetical protein
MDEISWILAGKAFANFQQNDAVSLKKSVALAGAMRPVLPMRYTYPDKVLISNRTRCSGTQRW